MGADQSPVPPNQACSSGAPTYGPLAQSGTGGALTFDDAAFLCSYSQ
jgi:hypothetical protein